MADIIFHIGFPKCASTTLQNQVFNRENGYLGTSKDLNWEENLAKRFQLLAPVGPRLFGSTSAASIWTEQVLGSTDTEAPGISRFLLSSEFLVHRNKLRDRPIISFLKKFAEDLWLYGKVKVLLIIRNQASKLASDYAQGSNINPYASQLDFENRILSSLNRKSQVLNYATWVKELIENFGRENICILLLEDIGKIDFWTTLKRFCDLKELNPECMINKPGQNTRRVGKNIWQLRPFDPYYKAKVLANNLTGFVWPLNFFPSQKQKFRLATINVMGGVFKGIFQKAENQEKKYIELTPDLKRKIQERFKLPNMELSELLKRDLEKEGY